MDRTTDPLSTRSLPVPEADDWPWLEALMAGFVIEAAAGFLAGALATIPRRTDEVVFFAACAAAAAMTGAVLVPGWIWTRGRFAPLAVLVRALIALAVLCAAAAVGFAMGMTIVLLPFSFFAAGAIAGLGAAAAAKSDPRTGPDAPGQVGTRLHLLGGLAGVTVTLLAAMLVGKASFGIWRPDVASLAVIIGPLALVAGSAPHDVMVVRAMQRAGRMPPPQAMVMRRAAIGSVVCVLIGIAALVLRVDPAGWWHVA